MGCFSDAWDRNCAAAAVAWRRMRVELFTTATAEKWFTLGFTAWLANLAGSGGGGGFNLPNPSSRPGKTGAVGTPEWLGSVLHWCQEHWLLIGVAGAAFLLVVLAAWLVLLWVGCRAQFMFADQVARRHLLVKEPWCEFKAQGNSYLAWSVGIGVAALGALAVWGGGVAAWILTRPHGAVAHLAFAVGAGLVLCLLLLALVLAVEAMDNFILPLMYRDRLGAGAAWSRFGGLVAARPWDYLAFVLLYLLLALAAGAGVCALILCTCCLAGCLMMIPYLGAVLLLPVTYFFRAFNLAFLEQVDPVRPVLM